MSRVVADAGPLIALARTGLLPLLRDLLGTIEIPPTVEDELRLDSKRPGAETLRTAIRKDRWIRRRKVRLPPGPLGHALGSGEAQAIVLAGERNALLLMDDRRARKAAAQKGIATIGTGRILLEAKRQGLLPEVAPALHALANTGYRIAPTLRAEILRLAQEE